MRYVFQGFHQFEFPAIFVYITRLRQQAKDRKIKIKKHMLPHSHKGNGLLGHKMLRKY